MDSGFEYGAATIEDYIAEQAYYQCVKEFNGEFAMVGAALGGGFENTNELHVLRQCQQKMHQNGRRQSRKNGIV